MAHSTLGVVHKHTGTFIRAVLFPHPLCSIKAADTSAPSVLSYLFRPLPLHPPGCPTCGLFFAWVFFSYLWCGHSPRVMPQSRKLLLHSLFSAIFWEREHPPSCSSQPPTPSVVLGLQMPAQQSHLDTVFYHSSQGLSFLPSPFCSTVLPFISALSLFKLRSFKLMSVMCPMLPA